MPSTPPWSALSWPGPARGETVTIFPGGDAAVTGGGGNSGLAKLLAELRIRSITDGIATINIVIEPDKGGDAVRRGLAKSRIRERARLVRLGPFKDASALHIDDPARFADRWREAISAAVPWREEADREAEEKAARAKEVAGELVSERDILGLFAKDVERAGGRRS